MTRRNGRFLFGQVVEAVGDMHDALDRRAAADVVVAAALAKITTLERGVWANEMPPVHEDELREAWVSYANSVLRWHYSKEWEEEKAFAKTSYCALRRGAEDGYTRMQFNTITHNAHEDRRAMAHAITDQLDICSGRDCVTDSLRVLGENEYYIAVNYDDEFARQIDEDLRGPQGLTQQKLAEEIADSLVTHVQSGKIPQISLPTALRCGCADAIEYDQRGPEQFL